MAELTSTGKGIGLRGNQGSVSMACLLLTSLALAITLSVTVSSLGGLRQARKVANKSVALSIAEAGADFAIAQLRASSAYAGTGGDVDFGDGAFNTSVANLGDGSYRITSTGSLRDGTVQTVELELSRTGSSSFPSGAVVSNGGAKLTGNSTLRTSPLNQHLAHVYANGNIQLTGNTSIDGGLYAGGLVSTAGNASYLDRVNGSPPVSFPTEGEINAMDVDWQNQARQGATVAGISLNGNQNVTYSTPLFINGNITLSGNSWLTFTGGGVVYVNGNIQLTGNQRLTNGGILIAKGTIRQTGNSIYTATGPLGSCGLVSLSNDATQAVQCTGNGDATPMGLIYAPRGGIKFTGNSAVFGGIVAGSTSANAVTCVGNGSVTYPPALQGHPLLPKALSVSSWLER